MAEKQQVAKDETVTYDGLFNFSLLTKRIKDKLGNMGYYIMPVGQTEAVTPEGKKLSINLKCMRNDTDYARSELKVNIYASKLSNKKVERQGKKKNYNTGEVTLELIAYLATDYQARWQEDKPSFYLIRLFFEKYVYSSHASKIKEKIREDVEALKDTFRQQLNMKR